MTFNAFKPLLRQRKW